MRALAIVLVGASTLVGGCFYEWGSISDIPDPSSPDGGGTSDGGSTPEGSVSDANVPQTPPPPPPTCTATKECSAGDFCDFADGACGKKAAGSCQPIPTTCRFGMFCTCDDTTRLSSDCAAAKEGLDTASDPNVCLTAPPQTFRCGDQFCKNPYFCALERSSTKEPSLCFDPSLSGCATLDCSCTVAISKYTARGCACSDATGHTMITCP